MGASTMLQASLMLEEYFKHPLMELEGVKVITSVKVAIPCHD